MYLRYIFFIGLGKRKNYTIECLFYCFFNRSAKIYKLYDKQNYKKHIVSRSKHLVTNRDWEKERGICKCGNNYTNY